MTSGVTILVVDDDYPTRAMIESVLERYANGPSIDSAANGKKALEKFEPNKYDCVISDLEIPKMGGFELCEEVREESEIPFISHTGRRVTVISDDAARVGVDEVISKGQSKVRDLAVQVFELVEEDENPIEEASKGATREMSRSR